MKKQAQSIVFLASCVAGLFGLSRPALSYNFFYAEDPNNNGNPLPSHPNSDAAASAFLSNLVGVGTETFDSIPVGTPAPLALTFPTNPGSTTATITNNSLNGNATIRVAESVFDPDNNNYSGRYPISGSNFLEVNTESMTITFSAPIAAFGFYGVDLGDVGAQLQLVLSNGTTLTVPHTIDSNFGNDGSVIYYGFIAENAGEQFTSVNFLKSAAPDVFVFENMTIGSLNQVEQVPVPPAVLGVLAFGVLSGGLKLKQGQKKQAKEA